MATAQDALRLFVQMVHAILPPGSPLDAQVADLAPNSVFGYDAAHQILLLRPSVDVHPKAQVLIGRTTSIHGPAPSPARGALSQIPPDEISPTEIVAIDAETGSLTLACAGQVSDLLPGQSRSLKQATGQAAEVAVIIHGGRLASIKPFPYRPDAS